MKVVNVNVSDLVGARFNNLALRRELAFEGVDARFLVWNQSSGEGEVSRMLRFPGSRRLASGVRFAERQLSLHAMLHLQSALLPMHKLFRQADVVHYHIIYDGYFSLMALPLLTWLKPSVWTFHDPFPITGHCIYPLGCEKWRDGCGGCPQLDLPFPMRRDRTALNFKLKQWALARSKVDVVVASRYMLEMTDRSPIASSMHRHRIPFGVDLNQFAPRPPDEARRRLGVLPGRTVVGLRAAPGPFKGLENCVAALERFNPSKPLCILTTQGKNRFNHFIGRHQILELGWVGDDQVMQDSFAAADFFLMPSDAEAFGLMAIEAMASGKPVIVTEGTSLPEIVFAPDVGMAVPARDPDALAAAMARLIDDEDERRRRGARARVIAEAHYDSRVFAKRLTRLYRKVAAKPRRAEVEREAA